MGLLLGVAVESVFELYMHWVRRRQPPETVRMWRFAFLGLVVLPAWMLPALVGVDLYANADRWDQIVYLLAFAAGFVASVVIRHFRKRR